MQASAQAGVESQGHTRMAAAVLLATTVLVFGPTIAGPFHLDDHTLLSDPTVTSPWGWWYVWRPLQTRPLTYVSFWLNYQAGGDHPAGYHAVNVTLHVIAAWLLFRLVERMAGGRAAAIAASIFALHPIQTEPVAYVFERATVLATVFCLLTAHAWLRGEYRRAIGLFILALLSKEECVAFPAFLLLLRPVVAPALWMLGLSMAAGVRVLVALEWLGVPGAGSRAGISPLDYLSTQGIVILRYLRLLLIPYGFTCDPDIAVVTDWRAWLGWGALLATAVALWKFTEHGKWFAGALLLLAPSSTIFPAEDLAADRRMYLPMISLGIFAGLLMARVRRRHALISIAAALAVLSSVRVHVWRSERSLWAEAVSRAPKKLRPRVMLARASDTEEAIRILDSAEALAPSDPRPLVEKGVRLIEDRQPERALAELERARALAPKDTTVLNNLGVALSMLGRRDEAIEKLRHALSLDPCSNTTRTNLERLGVIDSGRCE